VICNLGVVGSSPTGGSKNVEMIFGYVKFISYICINKRGRRLKRKSFIIQIKGVGAVPTFRSRVVIKGVDKAATSNSQFIGSRLPAITT
jgi:hypothetical protein